MQPWEFILICRRGGLAVGHFPFHDWHKREKENIIKAVELKIEYGQVLELPKAKGSGQSVGDQEHSQIIMMYGEEGLSMNKIATQLGRSTRTPKQHIDKHNVAVQRSGFCAVCRRVGNSLQDKIAIRTKSEGEENLFTFVFTYNMSSHYIERKIKEEKLFKEKP